MRLPSRIGKMPKRRIKIAVRYLVLRELILPMIKRQALKAGEVGRITVDRMPFVRNGIVTADINLECITPVESIVIKSKVVA